MKINGTWFRFIILSLLVAVVLTVEVYPQGTDSRRALEKRDKLYAGIILMPQKTNIINEGFSSKLSFTKGNSMNIAFEGAYFFSRFAGISLGAGLSPYSTQIFLPDYAINYDTTDTELEEYQMQIEGDSITESQKISFLSIPVRLALRFPAGDKFGFFLNAGISVEIPVVKRYEGKGTFTYDGYYPVYPVTLRNIPTHGFPYNLPTNVSDDLEIKSFNAALSASAGGYMYLGTSLQLSLGIHFNKSLSGVSGYEYNKNFRLTSKANELNSIMEGSSETGVQALGVSLGLKYFLK